MLSGNVEPEEKRIAFPCDKYPLDEDAVLYRAISILASALVVFRWLCQLRVAPYSHDRLDNLGRQSPQTLTLGVEKLEVGQRMMGFELVDFQPDQSITLRGKQTIYGDGVGSYFILPLTDSSVRLLAKIRIKYPRGLRGSLVRFLLPLGDLMMMRRQLLNLKKLSEKTYHTNSELKPGEKSPMKDGVQRSYTIFYSEDIKKSHETLRNRDVRVGKIEGDSESEWFSFYDADDNQLEACLY